MQMILPECLEKRVARAVPGFDLRVDVVGVNSPFAVAGKELGPVLQGGNSRSYLS